jgi:hypothetical protein
VTALDNLRKAAKRWLNSLRDGDPEARARLTRASPDAPDPPGLRDVQHALARERGYESWIAMTRAIAERGASEMPLTALLDAAGRGDAEKVAGILNQQPGIINERGALGNSGLRTALHFGSGHEAIVRLLLERGAVGEGRRGEGRVERRGTRAQGLRTDVPSTSPPLIPRIGDDHFR